MQLRTKTSSITTRYWKELNRNVSIIVISFLKLFRRSGLLVVDEAMQMKSFSESNLKRIKIQKLLSVNDSSWNTTRMQIVGNEMSTDSDEVRDDDKYKMVLKYPIRISFHFILEFTDIFL